MDRVNDEGGGADAASAWTYGVTSARAVAGDGKLDALVPRSVGGVQL